MNILGSSGGRVVKLLACGARWPGFDSRPRHLNFQRLVISCFQIAIWLKYHWSDVNPQYNQPTNQPTMKILERKNDLQTIFLDTILQYFRSRVRLRLWRRELRQWSDSLIDFAIYRTWSASVSLAWTVLCVHQIMPWPDRLWNCPQPRLHPFERPMRLTKPHEA